MKISFAYGQYNTIHKSEDPTRTIPELMSNLITVALYKLTKKISNPLYIPMANKLKGTYGKKSQSLPPKNKTKATTNK